MQQDVESRDKHLLEAESLIHQDSQKNKHEKEQELTDIKERLKEAVEFSEQQLQLVEQKEEEGVKLQMELQELTLEKDKAIQSLKDQLEIADLEHEDSVSSLKTTASMAQTKRVKVMKDLEQQIEELKAAKESMSDTGSGDAIPMINILQNQVAVSYISNFPPMNVDVAYSVLVTVTLVCSSVRQMYKIRILSTVRDILIRNLSMLTENLECRYKNCSKSYQICVY